MPEKRRHALLLVVPFLVLLGLHLALALQRERPLIFADEAGYLGNARYLAGGLPIKMLKSVAYYPGYSLIILPVFWLGLTPLAAYQTVLVLNSLLLSTVYVSLYYWIRLILGDGSHRANVIAFVTALYPAFILQADFALAESGIIALHAVLPLLVYWLVASRTAIAGVILATATSLLYVVHPRFVGTIGAVAIVLLLLCSGRVLTLRVALDALLTLGAGILGGRALDSYLRAASEGGSIDTSRSLDLLTSPTGIWQLCVEAVGQFWYLEAATAGLVSLGIAIVLREIFRREEADEPPRFGRPSWHGMLFLTLSAVAAFGISCLILAPEERVDHMIYGRYNEGVIAPVVATGAWALTQPRCWRVFLMRGARVGVVALGGALLLLWSRGESLSGRPNLANVLSLIPQIQFFSGVQPLQIGAISLAVFLLVSLLARWRWWAGLAPLGIWYLSDGLLGHKSFMLMQIGRARQATILDVIAKLPGVSAISYDQSYFHPDILFSAQYFFPHIPFNFFESAKGEKPSASLVLGHTDSTFPDSVSAQLLREDRWERALWSITPCCPANDASFNSYGARRAADVPERGFYENETWDGKPVRWTDGDAELQLPMPSTGLSDAFLHVDFATIGKERHRLSIVANDEMLFDGTVAEGRSRIQITLQGLPVRPTIDLHLRSGTFVPAQISDTDDRRKLGVAIYDIRVLKLCCLPSVPASGRQPQIP